MYLGHMVEIGESNDVYRRPLHPYSKALAFCRADPGSEDRKKQKTNPAGRRNPKSDPSAERMPVPHEVPLRYGRMQPGPPGNV